jgi:agmatine deiminase
MKQWRKSSTVLWYVNGLVLVLFFSFVLQSCKEKTLEGTFVPIAEFEDQETTFLCWAPKFQDTILRVVTLVAKHDHVTIFYNERNHQPENIRSLLKERKVALKNVSLVAFTLEKDNVWIRDYGPIFMYDEVGNTKILTFDYPHEANQEYNMFNEQYSSKMRIPFMRSKLFSAGGGREINGRGSIILVEGYEKFINPGLSLEEIEMEYKQQLNQKNVIWLKRGIPQDDLFDDGPVLDNIYGNGVKWHIDEFCRFADTQTILLAEVDSADFSRDEFYQVVHERLEENYQILKASKDQDGNPFKIMRIPQAPVIFTAAQYNQEDIYYAPVTSYLNFILTNNSVIIPSYYKIGDPEYIKEKDAQARKAFQEVFTNRKVVMINAIDLNYSGGGLHCISMSKPKTKNKRYFRFFESKKLG